ncbi:hypothetical protein A1O3_00832 [Capronia epimyces CBS 606.96]|uniref:Uncharacterized protein n=1 Tax=Capronia epimyces CBS 606.96 TaxID=1182542 RepID=W9YHA6_9EURO|nr:uncharacterized protein A1O3_00832 [Capronia epimyces CBS 606.96]EXJ92282.1 hypothetical protein A1O3_00832 [Capronia epimyces CBS 606.96]
MQATILVEALTLRVVIGNIGVCITDDDPGRILIPVAAFIGIGRIVVRPTTFPDPAKPWEPADGTNGERMPRSRIPPIKYMISIPGIDLILFVIIIFQLTALQRTLYDACVTSDLWESADLWFSVMGRGTSTILEHSNS